MRLHMAIKDPFHCLGMNIPCENIFYAIRKFNLIILYSPGPYGADISTPAFEVYFQTQDILRIKIYDPNNQR